MIRWCSIWTGSIFLAAVFSIAFGDEVLLNDGSRLVGTVGTITDGKLSLTTDFAGELKIDMAKVKGITTDQPVTVETGDGERARGVLRYKEPYGQEVTSPSLGSRTLTLEQMKAVWIRESDSPEAIAAVKAKPKWTARLEGAIDGQTGNSESIAAHGRVQVKRTTETVRFQTYLQGRFARRNGEGTANEIMGGMGIEADLRDRLFAFGKVDLEFDEFEDLDLRSTLTGGLGYFWIREKGHEFKTRAGVGYQHESFNSGTSSDQLVIEAGVDYLKQMTSWLLFTHKTTYFPTLDGLDDFRLVSETAGEIPIDPDKIWRIRIGMRNEFDNLPRPGVERLDTYYFLSLVMDFD